MGVRIRVPLRVLLPCLAVGLVAIGAVAIGVAEVSGTRGYLVRQADNDLLGCAKTMLMRGFAAVPGSGPVSGQVPGWCGMELLSDSGQVLIAAVPAAGRPAVPARGSWLAAHLAQQVTVPGTGWPWRVSVEPVRYRPQRILFAYGADDVQYLIGRRAGPGISGMLVVMAPLPGAGSGG
ncbi:MAG: hypothetical protein JO132_12510 [Streptosporangiaceae bacterium]|nr:hypothetical protein [Streptosporangiaceae bacterium]